MLKHIHITIGTSSKLLLLFSKRNIALAQGFSGESEKEQNDIVQSLNRLELTCKEKPNKIF